MIDLKNWLSGIAVGLSGGASHGQDQSTILGWLVGKQIAGQRKRVSE